MINNENSILVVLSVSFWGAYKKDKEATAAATQHYGMRKGSLNSTKKLLPRVALKKIKNVVNQFKTYFQDNTLPYNFTMATRILPTEHYLEFVQAENDAKQALAEAVAELELNYEKEIELAAETLGDLFRASDYPDKDALRHRFKIHVDYLPVPEPDQFNQTISNIQVAKLTESMEKLSSEVTLDLFLRAEKTVHALHAILLKDAKRIFTTTTQTNIQKLIQQMSDLNYNANQDIEDLRKLIETELGGVRIDYIKNSEVYREKLKTKTTEILTVIADYHDKYAT